MIKSYQSKLKLLFFDKRITFVYLLLVVQLLKSQPIISSFSPKSGPAGTVVTITGNNFSSTSSENIVYFGTAKGTVLSSTTTMIQAITPANSTEAPITVTTNYKTASSTVPFYLTFQDGGFDFNTNSFSEKTNLIYNNAELGSSYNGLRSGDEMVIGDIDADGKNDIVTFTKDNNALLVARNITNNASFSFDFVKIPLDFKIISPLKMADFNGDGKQDISVWSFSDSSIYVIINTSTPGTISFGEKLKVADKFVETDFAVDDFNNDGKIDIAYFNSDSLAIFLFTNTGQNGSVAFDAGKNVYKNTNSEILAAYGPTPTLSTDFNNDGKKDLLILLHSIQKPGEEWPGRVLVLKNTGTAGIASFEAINFDNTMAPFFPVNMLPGDLNGDGFQDLIETYEVDFHKTVIYPNAGSSVSIQFQLPFEYYPPESDHIYSTLRIHKNDLNGDAMPDLFSVRFLNDDPASGLFKLQLSKNTSTSSTLSFSEMVRVTVPWLFNELYAGDFDNDSKPELAYMSRGYLGIADTIVILRNTATVATRINSISNLNNNFKVFPNPSTGIITIQLPKLSSSSVLKFHNTIGQIVKTVVIEKNNPQQLTLDLRNFLSGIYTVILTNGTNQLSERFVLQ